MDHLDALPSMSDRDITATVLRERSRLAAFIRSRVPDPGDAEDILQDVFFAFVEACRLPEPIEQACAWLFRVARNRIVDRFRKRRELPLDAPGEGGEDEDGGHRLDLALPAVTGDPEAAYARYALLETLQEALEELPARQREVFMAHELEGLSFRQLAQASGEPLNTLLARKRQAVLHLRARLAQVADQLDL